MMGDNRDNSQDSRFLTHVGYVPKENLVGRATIIFFSNSKPTWQFWNWPSSIRFERVLKKVD
jgi:signal peptidase I